MVKAKSFRYLLSNGLESARVVFWRNIDDAPTIIEAENLLKTNLKQKENSLEVKKESG